MAIYQGETRVANNYNIISGALIDDNATGADSTWSSEKIDEITATKLDNTKLTSETENSVIIYVNSATGSDDNDGTNAAEPMKTISFEKIHQRFGYPKSILIILTEDYDIAGTPIDAKGEQWVGIRGSAETLPYKKIYSSVATDTLVKAERTQVSYNYLTLDGTNATTSLVYSDCNCCYFDNVQAVTNNVATESLINARRANIMAKNSAFSSNKTDTSATSLVSGYNSIITLNTCTVSVRNLSSAINSIATKIDGSISYVNETKDDNAAYELSVVRHSEIPTSLPANGGNADTLDSKHASDFLQNQGILSSGDLLEHILTMTDSGCFFAGSGVTSTPVEGQWFWIEVRRDERGDYCVTATRYNQGGVYTNRYNNNDDMKKWYGWSNVADGGNAATVSGHTVLTNVPANAKFTGINDTSTTSTTKTWSAKKINDSSFAGRIVISMDMTNTDTTLSATLNPTNGAYLYWASRAGNAQVYEIGMFLYTQTSWAKIPLKATDTATTVTFSLNGNKLTATRSSTTSFPTACGVIALGKNI